MLFIYFSHYFAWCTRAAVCDNSVLGWISSTYFGGQMAGKSQMRWWHSHLDGWFPAAAASCIDVKGHKLGGRCVRNTTVAKYGGKKGGRRTRPDKKTLRTTTKPSRGWQEGLKNRNREALGEDLFLWTDGDSASFRRGRRLGQRRAQIQPLWRARGLPAPKRDTLNHLVLVAECLLKPGRREQRVKWRTASFAVAFIKASVCVRGVERGGVNWAAQWRSCRGSKLEMLFSLKAFILHLRVGGITSSLRCFRHHCLSSFFFSTSHTKASLRFPSIALVSKCRVTFIQPHKFKGLRNGAPS